MAVIWKDSQMFGYLALGVGLLLGGWRSQLGALVPLSLASAMRHNAFTFTLPIVVISWRWQREHPMLRRYAQSAGVWLALTAVSFGCNAMLTTKKMHPWSGSLAIFDIVGTLRFSTDSNAAIAEELRGVPVGDVRDLRAEIRRCYSPSDGVFRIVDGKLIRQPVTDAEREAIGRSWWTIVTGHPGSYLHHRWKAFRALIGLPDAVHQWVWVGIEDVGRDVFAYEFSRLQLSLQDEALALGTTWIMRPYVYLLVIVGLSGMIWRTRDRLMIALALSAVTSELALFFLAPTPDFRYSMWSVPVSITLVITLFATRWRQGRDSA